jgi:dipeptidyl-peptidase 4
MRFLFFISTLLVISNSLSAQKKLSMADAILLERSQFRPTSLSQLQWIPDNEEFTYIANQKLVKASATKPMQVDTIDVLAGINQQMVAKQKEALKTLPVMVWKDQEALRFASGLQYFEYQVKKGKLIQLTETLDGAENQDQHENGRLVAYTLNQTLIIADEGKQTEVVKSEGEGIVYGKSVHREEFGIFKGTFWSHDGSQLAFYRMDESMIAQYPMYVLDSMPAKAKMIRYPFAGTPSHHVTVGVYNLKTKKITYLLTGLPADQYLTNVTWTADSKAVVLAQVNRAQNQMFLRKYDPTTGQMLATLLEEKAEKWVEPEHPAEFISDKSGRFIWQSEKNGFSQLYLHGADGRQIRPLNTGKMVVTQNLGLDPKHKYIYYQYADSTGLNRYIARTNLETGAVQTLTNETGTHTAQLSKNGEWLLDDYTSLSVPRQIHVRSTSQATRKTLIHESIDATQGYAFGKSLIATIYTPDGIGLNTRTILPPNYDASKKYPALVYVYNGPHVQLVTNTWMAAANLWMHRLAQEGYIVFTIDGRGSANRGYDFESSVHRQLGTLEVQDQLTGVQELLKNNSVDSKRIAVYGWSYGGFMTTSLLTRPEAEGVFKCGIAGGAVTDWRMYEIMYTERYMDTPLENPDGYQASSTFTHLPNLKAPLLMIHGSSDDVVLWQNTLKYTQECVRKGIQLDYFVYPEHLHNVRGKDRVHLFEKIEAYLKDKL